jgi:hypothetical protein
MLLAASSVPCVTADADQMRVLASRRHFEPVERLARGRCYCWARAVRQNSTNAKPPPLPVDTKGTQGLFTRLSTPSPASLRCLPLRARAAPVLSRYYDQ